LDALEKVDQLIKILRDIKAAPSWLYQVFWAGFVFSVLRDDTYIHAQKYGQEALSLFEAVYHPDSDEASSMRAALTDPKQYKRRVIKHAAQSA
jgi:hypothetical protein